MERGRAAATGIGTLHHELYLRKRDKQAFVCPDCHGNPAKNRAETTHM
jgi:hypothetical protein